MRYNVTINGETLSCAQWAKELGITRGAISFRMHKFGETAEEAVSHFYHHIDTREIKNLRIRLSCAEDALRTIVDDRFISALEFVLDIAKELRGKVYNVNNKTTATEKGETDGSK